MLLNKKILLLCLASPLFGIGQKRVSDLALQYNSVITNSKDSAKKIVSTTGYFIKGNLSRAEVSSNLYNTVTIYDSKAGTGVILKEVNGQKLLIRLNAENWEHRNRRFANLNFVPAGETRMIAGYHCQQAKASTAEGFEIMVFYTRDLIPENKTYDPPFKNLDGLPMEYEMKKGDLTIRYTLASVNLNPIPISKFDIPTSGYREMTYDESLKMKGSN